MIYVKDTIQSKQMDLPQNDIECVGVAICLSPEMSFNIIVLYRPPNEKELFYDQLREILKACNNKETILMGDFNLNWLDKACSSKLKSIAKQLNFTQMIKGPTRLTSSSKTLIDLLFTNKSEHITNLITGLSDHNLILVSRKLSKARYRNPNSQSKVVSCIPKRDMELVDREMKNAIQHDLISGQDIEQASIILKKTITTILTKFTKTQQRSSRRVKLPWFSERLSQLIKQRDAALKKFLKSKLTTDRLVFNSFRNQVVGQLRKANSNYFLEVITQAKGNSKLIWKCIDTLSGKERAEKELIELASPSHGLLPRTATVKDSQTIANMFNNYFITSMRERWYLADGRQAKSIPLADERAPCLLGPMSVMDT